MKSRTLSAFVNGLGFDVQRLQTHGFLAVIVSLALLCTARRTEASAASAPSRPNILLMLADNWAWPHASICGDKSVQTPAFDQIAQNGVVFTHAFCQVPSCSAARAVLLTGQVSHRLGEAANLWGNFPERLITYPALLEKQGYRTGYMIKGWGPGRYRGKKHTQSNPAGESFGSFAEFLDRVQDDQPFCFWFGSHDAFVSRRTRSAGTRRRSFSATSRARIWLPNCQRSRAPEGNRTLVAALRVRSFAAGRPALVLNGTGGARTLTHLGKNQGCCR